MSDLFSQHLLRLRIETGREFLGHLLLFQKGDLLRCDGASTLFRYPILGGERLGGLGSFGFEDALRHCGRTNDR